MSLVVCITIIIIIVVVVIVVIIIIIIISNAIRITELNKMVTKVVIGALCRQQVRRKCSWEYSMCSCVSACVFAFLLYFFVNVLACMCLTHLHAH